MSFFSSVCIEQAYLDRCFEMRVIEVLLSGCEGTLHSLIGMSQGQTSEPFLVLRLSLPSTEPLMLLTQHPDIVQFVDYCSI